MRVRFRPGRLGLGVLGFAVVAGALTPAAARAAATGPRALVTPAPASALRPAPTSPLRVVTRLLTPPRGYRPVMKNGRPTCLVRVGLYNGSTYGPPWGEAICGEYEQNASDRAGHWESFVMGGDYAIWHTWTGQSGWSSLGGYFCGGASVWGTPCGVYLAGGYPNLTAEGYGPDGQQVWCDTRTASGGWPGWYRC